jgi:hypothetical protein
MQKPEQLNQFMYYLMKQASINGLYDLFEDACDMTHEEVDNCMDYIEYELGVKL